MMILDFLLTTRSVVFTSDSISRFVGKYTQCFPPLMKMRCFVRIAVSMICVSKI